MALIDLKHISKHFCWALILVFCSPVNAFDYLQPLPEQALVAKDNPLTKAKIALGKRLFFDTLLSKTNSHSCNYCHNLYTGGDDDRAYSQAPKLKPTSRSAPGLWNIGLQTVLYWDGRIKPLEKQSKDHLLDPRIMANSKKELLKRLVDAGYQKAFEDAFGDDSDINLNNIAKALASFQRALMAPNSPFDRYLRGNKNALSETAIKGIETFNNAGCLACHFGVNFAGPAPGPAMGMGDGFYELFPNNLGSSYDQSHKLTEDLGRYEYSKDPSERPWPL